MTRTPAKGMAKRLTITAAMLQEILDIKCGRCGGPAKLHPPVPGFPNGLCICPACSFNGKAVSA